MKPLKSIDDGPSNSREFLAEFVGTILIVAIIVGMPLAAILISLSGFIPYQPVLCIAPVMFTLGGIQLLFRLVKDRRSWALLGVGVSLLLAVCVWLLISIVFRIHP